MRPEVRAWLGRRVAVYRSYLIYSRLREKSRERYHRRYVKGLQPRHADILLGRYRYRLDLWDFQDYQTLQTITHDRGYERGTASLLEGLLHPGSTFVDCGAHNGYFSLLAAQLVGDDGRVVAFEPNPMTFQKLSENIRINGISNVELLNLATSDKAGSAKLYQISSLSGQDTMVGSEGPGLPIVTTRLDQVLSNRRVDVVKIDVEGSEVRTLRGMNGLWSDNPGINIIVEWNRDYSAQGLLPFLLSDFVVYRIDDGNVRGTVRPSVTRISNQRDLPGICNLWAKPTGPQHA